MNLKINSFLQYISLITALQICTSSALASRNKFWEIDTIYRRTTGHYHAKMTTKLEKVECSVSTLPTSIKTLGILMLLAAHFQPAVANQSPIMLSTAIDPYEARTTTITDTFSTNNSTTSYLQCEIGARILGAQQARSFTLLERHCSHSGAFVLNRNLTTPESITEARIKDFINLETLENYHLRRVKKNSFIFIKNAYPLL